MPVCVVLRVADSNLGGILNAGSKGTGGEAANVMTDAAPPVSKFCRPVGKTAGPEVWICNPRSRVPFMAKAGTVA